MTGTMSLTRQPFWVLTRSKIWYVSRVSREPRFVDVVGIVVALWRGSHVSMI